MSSEEEVPMSQLDITDQPDEWEELRRTQLTTTDDIKDALQDSDTIGNKSKVDELIQKDITDVQHFKSTMESLSRMVFHLKDGVSEEVIRFGIDPQRLPMPNDIMFAYAFEGGLLQMCLKNLVRFSNEIEREKKEAIKVQERRRGKRDKGKPAAVNDIGNDEALVLLDFILSGAIAVMFNDKSLKAIAKVYADVVLAVKDPDVRALEKNSNYAKVVKQVLHILGTNIESLNKTTDGAGHIICNTCKTNLEAEGRAIKRCGGCKKVTYCSVECQKADWKAHKEHCRKTIVDPSKHNVVNLGTAPMASHEKMTIHSENVLQAAQAVFNEGIVGWLQQANADGLNILDCLIIIDFREHLPHATVMTQEEFIGHDDYWGGVEPCPPQMKSFLKDHHAKMTKKGSLLALCLTLPPRDKPLAAGRGSMAVTPAPFGGHFFPGGWPAYQASLR